MSKLEPQRPADALSQSLGGALGAPARYEVAQLIPITPGTFPWATFWTNVSGAFVLGVFLTIVIERFPPTRFVRPFFGIGFLGAYTTFSTLAVETATLGEGRECRVGRRLHARQRCGRVGVRVPGFRVGASSSDRASPDCHARRGAGGLMLVAGIAFAGAVGAPLRYLVDRFVQATDTVGLPARYVRDQRQRLAAPRPHRRAGALPRVPRHADRRFSGRGSAVATPPFPPSPTRRWRSPRRVTTAPPFRMCC